MVEIEEEVAVEEEVVFEGGVFPACIAARTLFLLSICGVPAYHGLVPMERENGGANKRDAGRLLTTRRPVVLSRP